MSSTAENFFQFMVKREKLRLRKESGASWPWSDDRILNTYKFTNVKREHDRTTRWMRRHWTGPNQNRPSEEIIFNCALFRYFGNTDFASALGWQHAWSAQRTVEIAQTWRQSGRQIFTGAYIIPTLGHRGPKHEAVCNLILTPLWNARKDIAYVSKETQSWRLTADAMRKLPGFGGTGFMTKEVLQDVMQTPVLRHAVDRNSWCPAGPGARRGLNRIHGRPIGKMLSEEQCLLEMRDLFDRAQTQMPVFMPELELHDIQFQLCEFDKYERVRLGDGRPKSRYKFRGRTH
ncbi:MAG: putative DNA base hypermodification protein [Nitrososphaera sp.]|nr:putative DNA base hypermodification protein [Nitrososphaera sp.]